MNIAIVRAFIALRKFAVQYSELLEQLKELHERVGNHDAQLNQTCLPAGRSMMLLKTCWMNEKNVRHGAKE